MQNQGRGNTYGLGNNKIKNKQIKRVRLEPLRLLPVSLYRLNVVGKHADAETPVYKRQRGQEAYHGHVLYPSGLNKEETDKHQQYTVNKIQPPVAAPMPVYRRYYHCNTPIKEYQRQEVGENKFRQYYTPNQHKTDKHINNTAGNPPAPASREVRPGSNKKLHNTGQYKEPAENLRCNSKSGNRPEPVCEAAYNHNQTNNKYQPLALGTA